MERTVFIMEKNLTRISTRSMSRQAWLAERRKTIGGSDAAGIVGLSRYATPYTVWADKTGRLPDQEDNEAMRQGRELEEYVAKRWEESTGKRVRRSNALLYNPSYPFAHADIDRTVLGEDAGLECKTTSTLNLRQFRNVEFPEQYYVQCVHYLAVTGCQRWYLAVLVFGRGFFTFTLERDQTEIDALMTAEEKFWTLVEQDTPPALDGLEATGEALQVLYPNSRENSVELFGREAMLSEYVALQGQKKELAERISQIENTIKADMQDAESGRCGAYAVSWKTQTRRLFQPKKFALAHPEIDLQVFYRDSSSRPFRVREVSEDQRQAG